VDEFNKHLNDSILIFNKKIDQAFCFQNDSTNQFVDTLKISIQSVVNFQHYNQANPPGFLSFDSFSGEGPVTLELLRHLAVQQKLNMVLGHDVDFYRDRSYDEMVFTIKNKATYVDGVSYKTAAYTSMWLLDFVDVKEVAFISDDVTFTWEAGKITLVSNTIDERHLFKGMSSLGFWYQHQIEGEDRTFQNPLNKASDDLVKKLETYLVSKLAAKVNDSIDVTPLLGDGEVALPELFLDPTAFMAEKTKEALLRFSKLQDQEDDRNEYDRYRMYKMSKSATPAAADGQEQEIYTLSDERNEYGTYLNQFSATLCIRADGSQHFLVGGTMFPYARFAVTIDSYFNSISTQEKRYDWGPLRSHLNDCKNKELPFDTDPLWEPLVHAFKVLHAFKFAVMLKQRLNSRS
jgi:hypothetical protein